MCLVCLHHHLLLIVVLHFSAASRLLVVGALLVNGGVPTIAILVIHRCRRRSHLPLALGLVHALLIGIARLQPFVLHNVDAALAGFGVQRGRLWLACRIVHDQMRCRGDCIHHRAVV